MMDRPPHDELGDAHVTPTHQLLLLINTSWRSMRSLPLERGDMCGAPRAPMLLNEQLEHRLLITV
jgi:hypothetical protein